MTFPVVGFSGFASPCVSSALAASRASCGFTQGRAQRAENRSQAEKGGIISARRASKSNPESSYSSGRRSGSEPRIPLLRMARFSSKWNTSCSLALPQVWWTNESHRKAYCCRDPTSFSPGPRHCCRMKPLSTTRNLCVCQHAQSLCASSFSRPHLSAFLKPYLRESSAFS
jgi:hypothetical protein